MKSKRCTMVQASTATITVRTDSALKAQANELFEELGMNLSVAITMFLKQAVMQHKYPCPLELNVAKSAASTYPPDFFNLFGSGATIEYGIDKEPEDVPSHSVRDVEAL